VSEISNAPDDFTAWAFALKTASGSFRQGHVAQQLTESGESAGYLYTGTIDSPAESSGNLCFSLGVDGSDARRSSVEQIAESSGATGHLRKAYGFLDADPPDAANAAKEAISALEGLAQFKIGDDSATLGEAIKRLRRDRRLHPTLADCLEKLWGFTNQSPGVRHGSNKEPSIAMAEAQFVVTTCEAAIQLLLAAT